MNKLMKKIASENFKNNSDLQVQYIFADGYCFYVKKEAELRKKETGKNFTEIKRDSIMEVENSNDEDKKYLSGLIVTVKEKLLDAKDDKKEQLEKELKGLEDELSELENK